LGKVKELKNKNNSNNEDENFADNEAELIIKNDAEKKHCEIGTDAVIESEMNLLPANKYIKCCWNCLKVLLEENSIGKIYEEKAIKEKVIIYYIIFVKFFFF